MKYLIRTEKVGQHQHIAWEYRNEYRVVRWKERTIYNQQRTKRKEKTITAHTSLHRARKKQYVTYFTDLYRYNIHGVRW